MQTRTPSHSDKENLKAETPFEEAGSYERIVCKKV